MAATDKYANKFNVMRLVCGQLPVVVGAAPASTLCRLSFADVLDEDHGDGYQRPIDLKHAREFREYITGPRATTIPLTLNLRGKQGIDWRLKLNGAGVGTLEVREPPPGAPRVLAQVDCQHRLGAMSDSEVVLTFQCYLGLTPLEEMAVFHVINGKAKGLNSSLLDFHTTKLFASLDGVPLNLVIAKQLNDDRASVWHKKLKLGGKTTQGTNRPASLRGLQLAARLYLQRSKLDADKLTSADTKYEAYRGFWRAVSVTWPAAWAAPRKHLITKGVGVQALSLLAGDIVRDVAGNVQTSEAYFANVLARLAGVDWSSTGPFRAHGGRKGASQVHEQLAARLFNANIAQPLRVRPSRISSAT